MLRTLGYKARDRTYRPKFATVNVDGYSFISLRSLMNWIIPLTWRCGICKCSWYDELSFFDHGREYTNYALAIREAGFYRQGFDIVYHPAVCTDCYRSYLRNRYGDLILNLMYAIRNWGKL
jgi:hypothetical protein